MTINLFHSGYLQTGTLTNSEDPDDACNGPSLNSEIDSIFTVAMVKKWLPNRLKIGKWPFWSKIKTLDGEINIEHKQIPKDILTEG